MTVPTLFDALHSSAAHAPAPLLTPEALEALAPAAQAIPAAGTGCFYFEAKLREGAPDVDLVFELNRTGMTAVGGRGAGAGIAAELAREPAWQSVVRYCREATAPDAPSVDMGGHTWPELGPLWLEFDARRGGIPGVFSGLMETLYGDPLQFSDAERPGWYRRRIARALEALGLDAPDTAYDLTEACVRALPEGVALTVFGVMMQRPQPALRLCFERMEMDDVVPYLRAIGWDHDTREVEAVLDRLAAKAGDDEAPLPLTYLHVDVWDHVMPRIGVEFCFRRPVQFHGRLQEARWLDRLVDLGLASPEKCEALAAWPGVSVLSHAGRAWRPGLVNRRVNHVKVVFEHGRVEAKAYFCCTVGAKTVAPVEH